MLRHGVLIAFSLVSSLVLVSCNPTTANLCSPELIGVYDGAARNFKQSLDAERGRGLASLHTPASYQETLDDTESNELITWATDQLRQEQMLLDYVKQLDIPSSKRTKLKRKLNDLANELGSLAGYAPHAKAGKILKLLQDIDKQANEIHALACG